MDAHLVPFNRAEDVAAFNLAWQRYVGKAHLVSMIIVDPDNSHYLFGSGGAPPGPGLKRLFIRTPWQFVYVLDIVRANTATLQHIHLEGFPLPDLLLLKAVGACFELQTLFMNGFSSTGFVPLFHNLRALRVCDDTNSQALVEMGVMENLEEIYMDWYSFRHICLFHAFGKTLKHLFIRTMAIAYPMYVRTGVVTFQPYDAGISDVLSTKDWFAQYKYPTLEVLDVECSGYDVDRDLGWLSGIAPNLRTFRLRTHGLRDGVVLPDVENLILIQRADTQVKIKSGYKTKTLVLHHVRL